MGAMQDLRQALIDDLAGLGVPVMDALAIRAEPPCVLLLPPSDEYVVGGQTFGTYTLNIDVACLVLRKDADDADRADLEDLIEAVLINSADWALKGVDSPGTASLADSTITFLGAVIHLAKQFTL